VRLGARALSELDAAPAAEAAPVEAAAPAPAAEPAPAEAAPAEAAPAEAAPAEPAPTAEPMISEFDFTGWDGQIDSLPESDRRVATAVTGHYDDRIAEGAAESQRMQEIYEALIAGEEDPRLAKLTTGNTELQSKFDGMKTEYQAYRKQVKEFHAHQAEAEAQRFMNQHGKLLATEKQRETFSTFLNQGWNQNEAVKLLSMDPQAVAEAVKAKSEGVPDFHAIRLAELSTRRVRPEARDSARITSGATNATSRPYGAENSVSDAKTLHEKRRLAVARAIISAKG